MSRGEWPKSPECPNCGAWWSPTAYESASFPGSACDTRECICTNCEGDYPEDCPRHGLTPEEAESERVHAREQEESRRRGTHRIILEISGEDYRLLEVLTGGEIATAAKGDVLGVISHIVHGFVDGIRRPGSWERGCVQQFFGDDFEERLVEGDAPWRRRPKGPSDEIEDDWTCSHCGAADPSPAFFCTVDLGEGDTQQACDNLICGACVEKFGKTCRLCITDPNSPLLHKRVPDDEGGAR